MQQQHHFYNSAVAAATSSRRSHLGRTRIKSLDCIENSNIALVGIGRTNSMAVGGSCRLLRRQFSLDRADEPTATTSSSFNNNNNNHHLHYHHHHHQHYLIPGGLESTTAPSSSTTSLQLRHQPPPRLFKQNSAGATTANNDLERIEEVPGTPISAAGQSYRQSSSVSLSVESLTLN